MSVWDLSCYLYLNNKQRTPAAGEMPLEWFSHFPCFKKPNTSGSIKQLNPCSAPAAVGKGMWAADPAFVKQRAALSRCVLEREAETRVGDKHIFRSDRQSSGNFLLAADPQGGWSPEPVITAAGWCTVESVTSSLKEMSGSKLVYTIYFQKGEMKTSILMVAILMTLRKTDSVKPKGCTLNPWVVQTERLGAGPLRQTGVKSVTT